MRPEKGKILFDGRDIMSMNTEEVKQLRKEIGMLFQGSALFDSETVLGNVMFPLVMFTGMTRGEMLDRAKFCIERVNLKGAENKYPSGRHAETRRNSTRNSIKPPLPVL